jgi:hypothetical protein
MMFRIACYFALVALLLPAITSAVFGMRWPLILWIGAFVLLVVAGRRDAQA